MNYAVAANQDIRDAFDSISKRLSLLESVFMKIAELDSRLNTLEFNSGNSVNPGISEQLIELQIKLSCLRLEVDSINEFLFKVLLGESNNVR